MLFPPARLAVSWVLFFPVPRPWHLLPGTCTHCEAGAPLAGAGTDAPAGRSVSPQTGRHALAHAGARDPRHLEKKGWPRVSCSLHVPCPYQPGLELGFLPLCDLCRPRSGQLLSAPCPDPPPVPGAVLGGSSALGIE